MIPADVQFPATPFALEPSLVLLGRRGSEAHGTFVPKNDPDSIDDRDLMGICIPPVEWTLGLRDWDHAEGINGVWDVVLYDYRKFVGLLLKQNPNVLSMLWLEDEDYLHFGAAGSRLVANRVLFQSRPEAFASFYGYAASQFKNMQKGVFRGYMGEKRKELVRRHGYDCKSAAHTVRLIHMGVEYMETGNLKVRRTWDRDILIGIKQGKHARAEVENLITSGLACLRKAERESSLPDRIDMDAVEELVVQSMRERVIGQ